MPLVTQILELSKSRSKIYIENEFAFVLYKGELRLYHIKENEQLADADYDTILHEILPKRAKLRAMHLLKAREYTEKQLKDKLKQQFYPQNIIEEAIAYVKEYRYVDDKRYADDFITYHIQTKSRRRIEEDLMRKGIDREIIAEQFARLEPEEMQEVENDKIRKLLTKKRYDPQTFTYEEEQKLMAFLGRKGFEQGSIRTVMRNYEVTVHPQASI